MAHMLNALIRAINDPLNIVLPRMIIIIMDPEFLKMMNYHEFGISMMIGRCLEWFMCQVNRLIHARQEDLQAKHLGAVTRHEPRIVWLKMVENEESSFANTTEEI